MLFPQTFWSCSQQLSPFFQSWRDEEKLNSLPTSGYLLYLQDSLSNRDYLVDTGASRSVSPSFHSFSDRTPPPNGWLGSRFIPLQFGTCHFQFQFLLPDVDQPIPGADFLEEFDLLVDTLPRFSPVDSSIASVCKLTPDVASLLDEFPGIHKHLVNPLNNKVEHVIETEGQLLYAPPHHLDQVKSAQAKAEFQKL